MTEQYSYQEAQHNPQILNGITSLPFSTQSLFQILFLMVLCIFTESHLKYLSDVFRILNKSWTEIKPNASLKNWKKSTQNACYVPNCAGKRWGIWCVGGESNTESCVRATLSMDIKGTP